MGILKDIPDLHTQPMRDVIYEYLRKAIAHGDLEIGTTFTDNDIAEEFGVSRTPVREAVQKLESNGYIERVPMRGNRVCGLSPSELAYTFAIRKALETLAIRYSAMHVTELELKEMRDVLRRSDEVFAAYSGEERLEAFYPLVRRFNELVFEACGSTRMTELIWAQREVFDRYRVMRSVLSHHVDLSLSRRKDLYEAFRAHDPDKAYAIWTEHLNESFSIWSDKSGYAKDLKDFKFF